MWQRAKRRERSYRDLPRLPAFNLDLAPVAFNKLLCDEQTDACAHGAASGEEGFKHSWQISFCDPYAVILNGQDDAIRGTHLHLPRRWTKRRLLASRKSSS